jgi:hypothetical protein
MATAAPNLNLDLADTSSITSEEEEEEDPLRPIHRLLSFPTLKSVLQYSLIRSPARWIRLKVYSLLK